MTKESHVLEQKKLLADWGQGDAPSPEITEMAALAVRLRHLRTGEALVALNICEFSVVERALKDKPENVQLLEYLADRVDGLRPEIPRILALHEGLPYYRTLPPPHSALQDKQVMKACVTLESTIVVTPNASPCLVFADFDTLKRYSTQGRTDAVQDPIRRHLGAEPLLALGNRAQVMARANVELSAVTGGIEQNYITPGTATTSIQKLLIRVIEHAMHCRSSNIAIQPTTDGMTVFRMRRFGKMTPITIAGTLAPEQAMELFNVLHSWAGATYISDKTRVQGRLQGPADGDFLFRNSDAEVFVRASFTLPDTLGGNELECISLRLLPRTGLRVSIDSLGFEPRVLEVVQDAVCEDHGLIAVCGPTGSGKSTTIHGMLDRYHEIYGDEKNCLSMEDPVERISAGIVSHSISQHYGFPLLMQAFLRQDPDAIFQGEIRDRDSASIAVRAAISGHLVFSTTHANNTIEMLGALRAYIANRTVSSSAAVIISDFDLISSLNLMLAQRLAPRLCDQCSMEYTIDEKLAYIARIARYAQKHGYMPVGEADKAEREAVQNQIALALPTSRKRNPEGCRHCEQLGFVGEIPINEILIPDYRFKAAVTNMIANNFFDAELLRTFQECTLFGAALNRIQAGQTPIDSIFM